MSKEQHIEFPEEYTRRELNARYREIPLKDTTSRLLRKYFNAMAISMASFHYARRRRSSSLSAQSWYQRMNSLPLLRLLGMSVGITIFWAERSFIRTASAQSLLTARSLTLP